MQVSAATWHYLLGWQREGSSQLVVEHEDVSLSGADLVTVFVYSPFHLTEDPGTVLGARDVEVRKVGCLWGGEILLKSREVWVPACPLVTCHPKLTLLGFQGSKSHEERPKDALIF